MKQDDTETTNSSLAVPEGCVFYRGDRHDSSRFGEWPLYIYCIEEVERDKPIRNGFMIHDFLILNILLDGRMAFFTEEGVIRLEAGDVLVIPETLKYGFESQSTGGRYHKLVVEFRGTALRALCNRMAIPARYPVLLRGRATVFLEAVRKAGGLLRGYREESFAELLGMAYELLSRISREMPRSASSGSPLLERALMLIEWNLEKPYPVGRLAEDLSVSPSSVSRLFREKLGCSPHGYQTELKMKRADLLLGKGLSVKEVAYQLGYCNPFHFSNEFRRFHGVSPRNRLRGR